LGLIVSHEEIRALKEEKRGEREKKEAINACIRQKKESVSQGLEPPNRLSHLSRGEERGGGRGRGLLEQGRKERRAVVPAVQRLGDGLVDETYRNRRI